MGAPSGGVIRTTMTTSTSNSINFINNRKNGDNQVNIKPAAIDSIDSNATTGTSCDIYLSLIQQYIAVFQIDNALFLAERCIADYPNCYEAIYMQALCYHRLHKFKNARACLNIKQHTVLQQQQVQLQQQEYKSTNNASSLPSVSSSYSTFCSMLYLSAQCSFELGDYTAAETTLMQTTRNIYQQQHASSNSSRISMDEWILQSTPCPIPNGAAGLALLGNICRKSNRTERAIQYFYMSLKLDPFLFTSFQALAELGETIHLNASAIFGGKTVLNDITNINQDTNRPIQSSEMDHISTVSSTSTKPPFQSMLSTPMISSSNHGYTTSTSKTGFAAIATNANNTTGRVIGFETPGLTPIAHNMTTSAAMHNSYFQNNNNRSSITPIPSGAVPQLSQQQQRFYIASNEMAPTVMKRAKQIARRQYYPPSPDASTSAIATGTPVTSVTRSMRYLRGLGTSNIDEMAVPNASIGANRSLFPSSTSENHDLNNPRFLTLSKSSNNVYTNVNNHDISVKGEDVFVTNNKPDDSVQEILNILTIAGAAYHHLCQYRCKDTVQLLQGLPISQQRTAWVLHQQGRALLEQGDFVSAQRSFEYMHAIDPGRMQGLELLSTVYWQLKKEVDLANLAQRTMDWDFESPHAHCVAGNCFSLQKDQETALVFFKRSLQLDPNFTYIHTLSGYEYMANEDFGKATSCFRKALQIDDRHYNAWYGLGMIYYRQEKYDLAEYHFERAVNIHPASGVLRCNLGMAQNANGKAYVALETLSEAFRLDPRNPQARFQRATIYSALHRPDEALAELKIVRDAAPREATVHFAMGKILKRLGRLDEAMKCFLTAMDLDPKDNQMIKSAMDKLGEADGDEDGTTSY